MNSVSDRNRVKLEILRKLVLIRLVEQTIAKRYPEQKMRCPVHLCLGQEATGAVFGVLAEKEDLFWGNYRSHGHYLGKGGDLRKMFLEVLGSFEGCSGGMGGSMHLVDLSQGFAGSSAIVAATIPQAAGAALSFKLRGEPHGVVVFFGDAAVEEGAIYETINLALLHQLPLIFVCENNRLAINTRIEIRSYIGELYKRFSSIGLRFAKISGTRVEDVIRAAESAFSCIHSGRGPFFIECEVERWAAHVGPAYKGPVDLWWQDPAKQEASSCPIAVLAMDLITREMITLDELIKLHDDTLREIENTFKEAMDTMDTARETLPNPENLVFSSPLLSFLPQKKLWGTVTNSDEYQEPSKVMNPF